MQARTVIILGSLLGLIVRLVVGAVLFISAGQVDDTWLMWVLLVFMSITITRGVYRAYRVISFMLSMSKLD